MNSRTEFIELIQRNFPLIRKVAMLYTNSADDRVDLEQEIIYQLWRSHDGYAGRSSLTTWMYRVAMNVAIGQLRLSKRRVQTVSWDKLRLDVPEAGPDIQEEQWQRLRQMLEQLNDVEKGLMMLSLDGKPHEEIAQIVGITPSNVGTRLARIREKLKSKLKPGSV